MVLKVLLADSVPEGATALEDGLKLSGEILVRHAPSNANLADLVAEFEPDVVIVDMARSDRDVLDSVRAVTQRAPRPIVMFVDRDDPDFMEEAIEAGVSSYNVVGTPPPDVRPIVSAAIAMFRRYRRVEQELKDARISLDERRAIDRAKAILIAERRVGEPEAYAWLRRKAMNENRRIVEIAADVIEKSAATSLRKSSDAAK